MQRISRVSQTTDKPRLLSRGKTRRVCDLITPSYTLSEIYKYKEEICEKSCLMSEEFDLLVYKLFKYVKVFPFNFYMQQVGEAKKIIKDQKDVPFIALSLAFNSCPIWSDDLHFKQQKRIKVYLTEEIVRIGF